MRAGFAKAPGNSTDQGFNGARMAGYQYSYVMKGLTKTFPGAPKPVLNNIHLQFMPDAKIAIIGVSGAGKSTLMKIMAGYDKDFTGEAWAAEGVRVGRSEEHTAELQSLMRSAH